MRLNYTRRSQVPPFHVLSVWKIEREKGVSRCQIAAVSCQFLYYPYRIGYVADSNSCVPCLSSGWTLAITEGSLENVYCPSVTCTKSRVMKGGKLDEMEAGIDSELVESVVGKDLRERWEWIKESRKAETGRLRHGQHCCI